MEDTPCPPIDGSSPPLHSPAGHVATCPYKSSHIRYGQALDSVFQRNGEYFSPVVGSATLYPPYTLPRRMYGLLRFARNDSTGHTPRPPLSAPPGRFWDEFQQQLFVSNGRINVIVL